MTNATRTSTTAMESTCQYFFGLDSTTECNSCTPLQQAGILSSGTPPPVFLCLVCHLCVILAALVLGRVLYRLLFAPLDLYRDLGSVGYVHHDRGEKRETYVRRTQQRKKVGDIPPVFPNGWFRLLDSRSLAKGQVKSVYAFGEHLAVFRNSRGVVRVLDAYCPHLGANMAAGGKVVNSDCLECPFHGWKFSGENGKLVDVPYAKKVPNFVSVQTWPTSEANGVVYVWYHCDKVEPQWRMLETNALNHLKYVGCTDHIINSHIQDIPENAADIAHLDHLHKPVIGSDVEQTNHSVVNNLLKHDIKAAWSPSSNPGEKHLSSMSIQDDIFLQLFGVKLHVVRLLFSITQIGPGAVHIHVKTPFFNGLMVQNITSLEPLQQKLGHSFYISPWVPTFIAKTFFLLETTQIERDILMWNNKTYLRNPVLLKEESTLAKHRRWYQQFYSENSPRLNKQGKLILPARPDLDDW